MPVVHGVRRAAGLTLDDPSSGVAEAWFTGSELAGVVDANLAHHRPHVPERLAAARDAVGSVTQTDPATWHLMRQVHGADVATVTSDARPGVEFRDVDILVTELVDRPLVVLAADCLPILAAGRHAIAAAHAGWRGVVADVPAALVEALVSLGEQPGDVCVVIGPGIGPCCYEVGSEVRDAVGAVASTALSLTRAGTPSVDLRRAVHDRFAALGVEEVRDAVTTAPGRSVCTACDPGWFSHRRDPRAGRQAGIVVRRSPDGPRDRREEN